MRGLRGAAWFIVVLILSSAVCSVLTDPYFDRFSDTPDLTRLERDGETRPMWRIPAVVPQIFVEAVALPMTSVVAPMPVRSIALSPEAPFVPPRL